MSDRIRHYLLLYDADARHLIRLQVLDDPETAAAEQTLWEHLFNNRDRNLEVVLLGSDSVKTLVATHPIYFENGDDDLGDLL